MSFQNKEGSHLVIQRCLVLLRRLQRGPAGKTELIVAVLDQVGSDAYGSKTGRSLEKRFEADKRRLRQLFGVQLCFRRSTNQYAIAVLHQPLFDLPDDQLGALAFLQETFGPGAPEHQRVQDMLNTLQSFLPPERIRKLQKQRLALQVEWGQRDDDVIRPEVANTLARALTERRLVEFDYHSPAQLDGQPRRHVVDPWERYFDSVRGHFYLRGYCRYTVGPPGRVEQNRYFRYRLGRISNVKVLPTRLGPSPPREVEVELTYRLAPTIARRGEVTRHPGIEIMAIESQADGGVVVKAKTAELWWAVRTLLHYGPNCRVLGGREALEEMRQTVRGMAQVYELVGENE